MELRRFFVKNSDFDENIVTVSGEEFVHAVKVLRYKVGYKIILSTGDGWDYMAEIADVGKDYFKAKITSKTPNKGMPTHRVTLCQASLKGGKNDFVAQKAVELGASEIVFFDSENVTEKRVQKDRLDKIALEAAKQCHRAAKPEIKVSDFSKILELSKTAPTVAAYEDEEEVSLSVALEKLRNQKEIILVVGSEGGFTKKEAEALKGAGAVLVSLGKRILRAETAAVSLLAITMYELGEMNA